MDVFDSDLVALFALTSGLGAAMIWLGARVNALELRDTRRRCPACGLLAPPGRRCRCSV
jgi:hypothetical protein